MSSRRQNRADLPSTSKTPTDCSTQPKHKITPAALYELFEANSQCVKNSEGRCPLLVFTVQFAEAINAYFSGE